MSFPSSSFRPLIVIDNKEIREKLNEYKNRGLNPRGRSTKRIGRGMVTFGTDDGAITDKTHLLPITRATGIPMVNAVVPSRVIAGGHLTLADLQTMQAEGWEITSHTWSHADLITLTDAEAEAEIQKAADWIEANGFGGRTLCIPYGHYGDREKLIAQKYHRAVRVSNTDAKNTINKPPIPTFELKSIWFDNRTENDAAAGVPLNSFARYKWWIDKTVAEGGWLVLFTHGWEVAEWGISQLLTDVINYAKTVADIVTFNEGLDRMDNVMESALYSNRFENGYEPHFAMSMDGKIRSHYQFMTKVKKNDIKPEMLPMDFENHTITVCNVDSTQTGWPTLPSGYKAGVVTTHAVQPWGATWDTGYYWQEFKPYGTVSGTRWTRAAKDGENLWGPWQRHDPSVTINARINTYNAATLPNAFPVGFRIQSAVNSANSAGMPAAATGIFITDATGLGNSAPTDFGFIYQEYHRYATNEQWRRVATNGTTWGPWQRIDNGAVSSDIAQVSSAAQATTQKVDSALVPTINLFNPGALNYGQYYYYETGGVNANQPLYNSIKIPITGGKTYALSGTFFGNLVFWTSNNTYISGIQANNWSKTFTAPANAAFCGFPIQAATDPNTVMLTEAPLPTAFVPYGYSMTNRVQIKPKTAGKNLLLFGDSITATATLSDDGATYTEGTRKNWPTWAKDSLLVGAMWNYAVSGASYKDRAEATHQQKVSVQITNAIANARPADIIVIAAGANDGNASIGDYDTAMGKATLADLDRTNLYESLRWAFWSLRQAYPDATCYASTPVHMAKYEPVTVLHDAIRKMARRYNFIVIDAEVESGIIRDFEVQNGAGRFLYDGIHPNDAGSIKLAKLFERVILNTYR